MRVFSDDKFYTAYQVQTTLGVTRQTLYNWIHEGVKVRRACGDRVVEDVVRLDADKFGGNFKILGSKINRFLADLNR